MVFRKMTKTAKSKALVIRSNLVFLPCFLIFCSFLLIRHSASDYHKRAALLVRCSLSDCLHHKIEWPNKASSGEALIKREKPSFLGGIGKGKNIGLLNMDDEDVSEWKAQGQVFTVSFERASKLLQWKDLFPGWIDEEAKKDGPSCPEIPMPNFNEYEYVDLIVAKLPCKAPEEGWRRDVVRLQVHLVAANMAVRRGKWDGEGKMKVVFLSKCMPMVELFGCDELEGREGEWWYYRPRMGKLEEKVSLPVGSCNLAMPLWGKGIHEPNDVSKTRGVIRSKRTAQREAYATVLHSSDTYVCGAITLAQSLLRTGTRRDLILLLDASISQPKRDALSRAGWQLRFIKRIRNPRAEKRSYNEYNYSKFRLWQLTDYDKVVFIDSDVLVLRSLDVLFRFPQISATGNARSIFNSGVMVIEPSNCTFGMLMHSREEIVSYNGGDQGFLNEVFVWWHRLPRKVNFLKNFWSNTSNEVTVKNQLFGLDPPKLYSIHYLGLKPWLCYRDYDCNWHVPDQRVYASDAAHARWWRVHDAMDEGLQEYCGLLERRKIALERQRNKARKMGLKDHHWWINVADPRRFI